MTSIEQKEILIVGAGPVGLALAVMLKQMSVPFRIIEKRTESIPYSRAFAIHSRTLEIFSQLKVLDAVKSQGRVSNVGIDAYKNGKESFKIKLPPSNSSESYTVGLMQSKTEEILERRLEELGSSVEHGVELESIHLENEIVSQVQVKKINGESEIIMPSIVVGCDGGHSLVRKLSNIGFSGESVDINLSCIDAVVDADISTDCFSSMFFHEKRVVALIWIDDKTVRMVIPNLPGEEKLSQKQLLEIVEKHMSPIKLNIKAILWVNTFKINERRADAHCRGNVYLCGDAAHVHSPAGGQGMNTGIQDAYNLAWKLSFIEKQLANKEVLDQTFHQERASVADMVLKNSGAWVRRITYNSFYNSMLQHYALPFAMSFEVIRQLAADTLSEVFIKYDHNVLIRDRVPGWICTQLPGVGLRIPPFNLFKTNPSLSTTVHQILNGGHRFEILAYVPNHFLAKEYCDYLKETLSQLVSSKTLLHLKEKTKNSLSFYQTYIVISTKSFQVDQWANDLKGTPSVEELRDIFNSHPTYIDQSNEIGNYFNFKQNKISLIIIRPDAYVGVARPIKPENCQQSLNSYFDRFILPTSN